MRRRAKYYLAFCAGAFLVSSGWLAWQYYQWSVVNYDKQESGVS